VVVGLAWVSISALSLEQDQRRAAARATRINKERLALWRLESQMLPTLGLENNRPYSHYFALHVPGPLVLTANGEPALDPGRIPSPLLSADLPPWVRMHVHLDPTRGWQSPQVIPVDLANRLTTDPIDLDLSNVTASREFLLNDVRTRFPLPLMLQQLTDGDSNPPRDDSPYVVPIPLVDDPAFEKPMFPSVPSDPAGWMKEQARETDRNPIKVLMDLIERQSRYHRTPLANGSRENTSPEAALAEKKDQSLRPEPIYPNLRKLPTAQLPQRQPLELSVDDVARRNLAEQVTSNRGFNESKFGGQLAQTRAAEYYSQQTDSAKAAKEHAASPAKTESAHPLEPQNRAPDPLAGPVPLPGIAPLSETIPTVDSLAKTTEWVDNFTRSQRLRSQEKLKQTVQLTEQEHRKQLETRDAKSALKPGALGLSASGAGGSPTPADKKQIEDELVRIQNARADAKPRITPPPPDVGECKPAPLVQPVAVHLGALRPRWIRDQEGTDHLFLIRTVKIDHRTVYQGLLVDWQQLRAFLLEQIKDLFPAADLTRVLPGTEAAPERTLSALPVELSSEPEVVVDSFSWTPLRVGLLLAWSAAVLAIVGVAFGSRAILTLSERRIRFVSAVTHELRTPLTALQLHLDLLNSGMITDEAKRAEYLNTLSDEAERLNRLVENVLDFAKLEKKTAQATASIQPLTGFLQSIYTQWQERFQQSQMTLVLITPPEPLSARFDERVLSHVLGNLLDNARKYASAAEDRTVLLTLKSTSPGKLAIDVEDRGPGVPTSEQRAIFKPFHRGRGQSDSGGVGLGLALARQWVEMFGGSLSYHTPRGGVGACFRVELPVAVS
jgi:signal transduction histidine kinase